MPPRTDRLGMKFPAPILLAFIAACAAPPEKEMTDGPDPRYWRYDRILTTLDGWAEEHPTLVFTGAIGTTRLGEPIRAMRLGFAAPGTPTVLFLASQHANEPNGTAAIMALAERLIADYGRDPEVTAWMANLSIWLVPVVNVDGHRHVFSGAPGWRDWRKNGRDNDGDGRPFGSGDGVDLNRNWDHRFTADKSTRPAGRSYKGPEPFSEPETRAVRDLVLRIRPLIVVDLHSPGKITPPNKIFWPWLARETETEGPDAAVFRPISEALAAATETEVDGEFMDGKWYGYDTLPKAQNWIYANTGACALLMEISRQFWWEGEIVDRIAGRVAGGLTVLLDRAASGPGIRGTVTDAATGEPIFAEVRVPLHHDASIGPRRTRSGTGEYFRLLNPGDVTVEIRAEGYVPVRRSVTVQASRWTRFEAALRRE